MTKQVIFGLATLALGGLGGAVLVGRAHAQMPPPVQYAGPHYQYMCVKEMSDRFWEPKVLDFLNAQGAQGWRLLDQRNQGQNRDVYCFERHY